MPKEIESLASQYLVQPVKIKIGRVSVPTANVAQSLERTNEGEKMRLLLDVLLVGGVVFRGGREERRVLIMVLWRGGAGGGWRLWWWWWQGEGDRAAGPCSRAPPLQSAASMLLTHPFCYLQSHCKVLHPVVPCIQSSPTNNSRSTETSPLAAPCPAPSPPASGGDGPRCRGRPAHAPHHRVRGAQKQV
jgi:hypothetical protein